ncbi:hypothetical protein DFJ43DRAFT_499995 [Lentinula guzmanii]|uniref:Uncharacterized protein n=1 Tax=Lentinula guzmanii TaxID=2804957 RepID=A0AA38J6Z1_9AGAR|nr:hypothetical protein DFJ43DRAFT_499995 [Lentinula guzmanii]
MSIMPRASNIFAAVMVDLLLVKSLLTLALGAGVPATILAAPSMADTLLKSVKATDVVEKRSSSECTNVNTGTSIGYYRYSADNTTCAGSTIANNSTLTSNSTVTTNASVSLGWIEKTPLGLVKRILC